MSNFTLLIPLKDPRHDLLDRQLRYYREQWDIAYADSGHRCEFPIVFADASDFPESVSAYERIAITLLAVKTPFVVIGADDDVFDVRGLEQAAAFLWHNSDYASCSGQTVTVDPKGRIAHYPQRSIELPRDYDRVYDHVGRYTTKWYAMQRTHEAVHAFQKTANSGLDSHLGELLPSCWSLLRGKSKVLDAFYMARRVWPDRPRAGNRDVSRADALRFGHALGCDGVELLTIYRQARKRSRMRCAWENLQASRRWSAKVRELLGN